MCISAATIDGGAMNAGLRRENGTDACLRLVAPDTARGQADEIEHGDDDALAQRQQGEEQKEEVVGLPPRHCAQMCEPALSMAAGHGGRNGGGKQGQERDGQGLGTLGCALEGERDGTDQTAAKDQGAEKRHQVHGFAAHEPRQGYRIGQNQQAEAGGSYESGLPLLLLLHGRLPVRWNEAAKLMKKGAVIA